MAIQPEVVEQLFEAALALKPTEREAFLDQVCSHDPELRRTVEELLAEDANAGSLLEHPPFDFLGQPVMRPPRASGTTGSIDESEIPPSPLPAGRLNPGQVLIDRFVIVRFIAKGGMGEVYEAKDSFLQGVHVALKTILPQIADDPALQQRFEREVLLAREVSHPNLCPIYDIFHCEQPPANFLFLTMKLLPGETLAARATRNYLHIDCGRIGHPQADGRGLGRHPRRRHHSPGHQAEQHHARWYWFGSAALHHRFWLSSRP
jgi:hypothetical protein